MATDVLSAALALVRLTGALVFEVDLKGSWGIAGHPATAAFSPLLPDGTTQVIAFHVVSKGRCWARHAAHGWFELPAGHAMVVTRGDPHDLCDRPGRATMPLAALLGEHQLPDVRHLRFEHGRGASTRLLCGFLGCDRRAFEPLCRSLPPVFEVGLGSRTRALVQLAIADALNDAPGARELRGRLAELLFLTTLRLYMRNLPADATGWLAGLRDPLVGRALQALHATPGRAWSVDQLAASVASSRSALAARVSATQGEPPMHYQARLRMQLAARSLHDRTCSEASVADEVGYDSNAAFQRAFKRHFGVPPAAWRREPAERALGHSTPAPYERRTHERRRTQPPAASP
jgi:AraC-like DNA-binding protein